MWMAAEQKYSHHFTDLLKAVGYTHCFFVPGGNIMHLLDSARTRMICVPFVHEVSATIAAEYFNQVSTDGRAYALVTAGPGLTNALTGIAGAYLESHELLVVGGQAKSADLARGTLRQRGIQEIDGVSIASPVCKAAALIEHPVEDSEIVSLIAAGRTDRQGPVFIECCLDAQGASVPVAPPDTQGFTAGPPSTMVDLAPNAAAIILRELASSQRPVLLIGGGISVATAWAVAPELESLGVPLMTTWSGADRVADGHPLFFGRPNTWGQRSSNILLAQADLIVALGTRLGLQQTGFNWGEWGPGRVVHVDVDEAEIAKGHPRVDVPVQADANRVLKLLAAGRPFDFSQWVDFCREVRATVPVIDPENSRNPAYLSPFELLDQLSEHLVEGDLMIPASSGSGQFVPMQTFRNKPRQRVVTNKGLAAMGYGLAAAIGACLVDPLRRTVLVEGDGSFSQNLQELGTMAAQHLNLKVFLLDNDGYASIRTTQRNYFGGHYLGCDRATGLGLPSWGGLAAAYGIPCIEVGPAGLTDPAATAMLDAIGPALFIVKVDPEQTYFPKVTSRVAEDGSMVSNPIHRMSPELPPEVVARVFRYSPNVAS